MIPAWRYRPLVACANEFHDILQDFAIKTWDMNKLKVTPLSIFVVFIMHLVLIILQKMQASHI
jgi:hypothetical protein